MRNRKTPLPRPPLARERRNLKAQLAFIQQRVASFYGVSLNEMLRPSRGVATVSWARQVAMHVSIQLTKAIDVDVAEAFKRDRTTVAYARSAVEATLGTYAEVRAEISGLQERLRKGVQALQPRGICAGCGWTISKDSTFCGECVCEEDTL